MAPLLLPLLAALFGLVALAWWWPNRPAAGDVAMTAPRFNSVSFAPFRDDQSPLTDTFPTAEEVEADVALIAPRVAGLRTYAANEGNYDVAAIAQRHGLKVWQGIWLGADRAQNAREIAKGIALARRYPDTIDRVVVGNEVLLRRDLPPDQLIAAIEQVRAAIRQPVTYGDVWEFWEQFPEIAAHVDIVTVHLLPYWEDVPTGIDRAVAHVGEIYHRMAALFPGKRIAIGETGWPSRGRWRADAAPGVVNEAVFLRRFIALAQREGFDYNLIEAFDQGWKYKSEGTVGANWGLWTADRRPKFPLEGPVVENPDWPIDAALSCAAALVLLAVGCVRRPPPTGRAQAALAILATALGGALAFAWAATIPLLYDDWLRIAAAANLPAQAALAILLVRRAAARLAAARLAGAPAIPAPTAADTSRAVQALIRLRLPPPGTWLDHLAFVFVWTALVLQLLLLFDARYRDFPFGPFAVPVVAVLARALLRDLPTDGGGREELAAGGGLALAAIATAVHDGPLNHQSIAWSVCALILAAPPLLRCRPRAAASHRPA